MIKFIDKIGFFRLLLMPIGLAIIITAFINGIWGMGVVGVIVLVFGIFNKCLLLGQCDVKETDAKQDYNSQKK